MTMSKMLRKRDRYTVTLDLHNHSLIHRYLFECLIYLAVLIGQIVTQLQEENFDLGLLAANTRNYNEDDDYLDVQSRVKGVDRYRPSFMKQNPRFFLNYITTTSGASNLRNPLLRTIRVTITSTINITSVQSCLASSLFTNAAAQNSACRRKREIFKPEDDFDGMQFSIFPSETQQ